MLEAGDPCAGRTTAADTQLRVPQERCLSVVLPSLQALLRQQRPPPVLGPSAVFGTTGHPKSQSEMGGLLEKSPHTSHFGFSSSCFCFIFIVKLIFTCN